MEWKTSPSPLAYPDAVQLMEERVEAVIAGTAPEMVWLLEHPPVYTAGTGAKAEDLLAPRFPVHRTGRGGQYTYHGPGQRVIYIIKDLKNLNKTIDIKDYIFRLQNWVIDVLRQRGVAAHSAPERIGVWVYNTHGGESKIAALGIRVRKGVAFHGISINIDPDLAHYAGIVPCGLKDFGVTSLARETGMTWPVDTLDEDLRTLWPMYF